MVDTPPRFSQLSGPQGSNPGGLFEDDSGRKWYIKEPTTQRQGHNEVMASRFYRWMGFDAIEYDLLETGALAAPWRDGLPDRSEVADLRSSPVVQQAFLPSALLANWDVIGLVADNCLYDPETMDEPVFIDFGGTFDTRAMGKPKQYKKYDIAALEGFRTASINRSATQVFDGMTPDLYSQSIDRIARLTDDDVSEIVSGVPISDGLSRASKILSRREVLLDTPYEEVFG